MDDNVKDKKELIEELEGLYSHVASESGDNLSELLDATEDYPEDFSFEEVNKLEGAYSATPTLPVKDKTLPKKRKRRKALIGTLLVLVVLFVAVRHIFLEKKASTVEGDKPQVIYRGLITASPEVYAPRDVTVTVEKPKPLLEPSTQPLPEAVPQLKFYSEAEPPAPSSQGTASTLETPKVSKSDAPALKDNTAVEKPYAIQVAAFKTREEAETLVAELSKKGYGAHWKEVTLKNGDVWFRTFIGSFSDRKKAKARMDELRSKGIAKSCFIQRIK